MVWFSSPTPGSGSRAWPGRRRTRRERDGAFVDWVQATRSAAAVPLAAVADLVPDEVRSDDIVALMQTLRRGAARPRRGP